MFKTALVLTLMTLTLCSVGGAVEPRSELTGLETREFKLESIHIADAMTILRTMVGARRLDIPGEPHSSRQIRMTDTVETLDLAADVLQLVDSLTFPNDGFDSVVLSSGDELIARLPMDGDKLPDAVNALRKVLRIRAAATSRMPSALIIRDTREKVEAAWELAQIVARTCPAIEPGNPVQATDG